MAFFLSFCIKILNNPIRLPISQKMFSTSNIMNNKFSCTDIVWMDLEMTGLDVENDKILEVACLITDKDLNIKSESLCLAINYTNEILENMNEWCVKQHNKSGLIDKCRKSKISEEKAATFILEYLKENVAEKQCPLAGNSVYMDRLFLRQHMRAVDDYMHYRIIDVSTIKELSRRWNIPVHNGAPLKTFSHRSLDDIKESLEELKYYREHLFKNSDQ